MEKTLTRRCVELTACVLLHFLLLLCCATLSEPMATLLRPFAYLLPAGAVWLLASPPKGTQPKKKVSLAAFAAIGAALGGICLATLLTYGLQQLCGAAAIPQKQTLPLLLRVTAAALYEECFYRMTLLPALCRLPCGRWTRGGAVLGTAVLFALWHPFPFGALFALLSGGVLGCLTLEQPSGYAAVAVHLLANWISFALLETQVWVQGLCYGVGVALGGVALWMLFVIKRKEADGNATDAGSDLYA